MPLDTNGRSSARTRQCPRSLGTWHASVLQITVFILLFRKITRDVSAQHKRVGWRKDTGSRSVTVAI